MEDVVGIRVRDAKNGWFGFVTWGRLWDPVDETELIRAVKPHLTGFHGITDPQEVHVCNSLRDLRSAEYFYEALISFSWDCPPFGDSYDAWRKQKQRDVQDGRDIYFVGALPGHGG
jgi:hypothetical protein